MARARNIKPSIMDHDELAELEPLTRLLFIYLWMLADREGRLEDRPKRIAGKALPYDRDADVDAMLADLQRGGFIQRYTVQGRPLIQIVAFSRHQSPHVREAPSDLPPPEQGSDEAVPEHNLGSASPEQGSDETSPRSPDSLIPDSLIPDTGFSDFGYRIPDTGLGTARAIAQEPDRPTAGEACIAMKVAGLPEVNPSHPTLIALLDAGITLPELAEAAREAAKKKKSFAYALATAAGRRRDAAIPPMPQARASPQRPSEPAWRTEQRERMRQLAPGVVAQPTRPTFPNIIDVEATDADAPRLA